MCLANLLFPNKGYTETGIYSSAVHNLKEKRAVQVIEQAAVRL